MIIAKIDYSNTDVSGTQVNGQVFISLFDAATGQPTNGDNAVIGYTQNINGSVTSSQATIAGQSAPIYSGLISDQNPLSPYFTNFSITNIGTVPNPAPPVNVCNLIINYISVNRQESAPGAADAQISVDATTSYWPVAYSLDNITFQSSSTFSGLTGGLKTVYATDANGCTNSSSITIPVLSNLLVSDPSVTLPGGKVSRWNAGFNPIVFTYQRKDFEVTAVNPDTATGNAAVSVNCDTTLIENAITANNQALANAALLNVVLVNSNAVYIYINAGTYAGTFQVVSVPASGVLLLNTPYNNTATGFININIMRPYYQVRTQISYIDPISGQQNTITSTNRPDNTGLVQADLSSFLQSLVQPKDGSNYAQINYRDNNLSASYQIAYTEYWDGKLTANQTLMYIPVTNPYYLLYAARQLGQKFGGNLAAYVPFKAVTNTSQLANWVTDFAEPAYSNGYPFDIGFIYSDDLVGLQIFCVLTPLDINGNPVADGTAQTSYLLNDDSSWLVNQDGSKLVIGNQTSASTAVPAQLGLNRLLVNATFGADVYYFNLSLNYTAGTAVKTITQTQRVRIDKSIDEQSVYLRWVGVTGSWNYYRFVYNQEISLDVQNAVIIKNYVFDWENQDGIEEVIGKSAGQKMKVMAEDLSINDIKGLQSVKYSPKVQMLVNKNPVKWQTVVLNTATFSEYETLNGQAPFSVTFNLPGINIQTQ